MIVRQKQAPDPLHMFCTMIDLFDLDIDQHDSPHTRVLCTHVVKYSESRICTRVVNMPSCIGPIRTAWH